MTTESQPHHTYAEQADAKREAFMAELDDGARQTMGETFARLMASDFGANAINVGDLAPDFTLPNARGGEQRLGDALAQGPVVLNFYRGGWCPFCNLEFRALQQRLPEMQALGARLIGISPETPDNSLATAEKHALQFDVLSDVGNQVAGQYGLEMVVDEAVRPLYLEWGLDIPAANGDDSYVLPIPATYVLDRDGTVRAAYVDKNYTSRMEPEALVAALRDLAG
jgi:peroxiredoxin